MGYHDRMGIWKPLLEQALKEDGFLWDWSTLALNRKKPIKAEIISKSPGVWAAQDLCQLIESEFQIKWKSKLSNGSAYKKGEVLVKIEGDPALVLGLERNFLNLAQYAGGIATETHAFVKRVKSSSSQTRITLTRKTLPYYRDLAIEAVRIGGGYPHRTGLSGGVLLKENHIAAAGGIREAIAQAKKTAPHVFRIEIEVQTLKEAEEAVDAGAEIIMLDNFTSSQVRSALKILEQKEKKSPGFKRPRIEVSGGMTLDRVKAYALPGVDVISVGGLTHSVKAVDLSLLVKEAKRATL